ATTRPPAATGNRVRSPAPVPVTTRLFVRCDRIPVLAMLLFVSSGRTWCLTQEHVARLSPIRVPARRYGKSHSRRTVMNRVIVIDFMSLDGGIQAPDGNEGFRQA